MTVKMAITLAKVKWALATQRSDLMTWKIFITVLKSNNICLVMIASFNQLELEAREFSSKRRISNQRG